MTNEHHPSRSVTHLTGPLPDKQRRALLRGVVGLGIMAASGLIAPLAQAKDLEVGQPAPPLLLHTLDGHTIATRDMLGQVVIATFWATWCSPCHEELPLLSTYAEQHAQDGFRVLGFSLDGPENLPKVKSMAANLSFPVGLLGNPYAGEYGRIWHIPVSFVIDRAGNLADNGWNDDYPEWTKERLHRVVDPLLLRKK